MYSVLIQNQSTMESYEMFHPLFLEAINKGQIGTCRWIESGKNLKLALPEIQSLTVDKEKWRAIIVRVQDEMEMRRFEADEENPYDFLINRDVDPENRPIKESEVPLIRLTHMLGGIPAPELTFSDHLSTDKEIVGEDAEIAEDRIAYKVYKPQHNAENERLHKELSEQYDFDGKRPDEILILTFHKKANISTNYEVEFSWSNYLEIHSSEFWRRNNYPGKCRFLAYDYEMQGRVQRDNDLFNFWMSVMLLATNEVSPSTLQAYRLYKISTEFNKLRMQQAFQDKVDDLVGTRSYIEYEIKRDREIRLSDSEDTSDVPLYRRDIRVEQDGIKRVGLIEPREFKLCAESSSAEFGLWEGRCGAVENGLDQMFKGADRALEKSTDRMRKQEEVLEYEVRPLNHFQIEDMQGELDSLYVQILNAQDELTGLSSQNRSKLREASESVKETLRPKIISGTALMIFGSIVLGLVMVFAPGIIYKHTEVKKVCLFGLIAFLCLLAVYGLVEFAVLKIQHRRLSERIMDYNQASEAIQKGLTQSIKQLSDFVSNVVSYARGNNYLNLLERQKHQLEYAFDIYHRHMIATNGMLDKLRRWGKAYYLTIDFDPEADNSFRADIDLPPQENYLYTFDHNSGYEISVNETGEMINSPFDFVSKLNIIREELFEHAETNDKNAGSNSTDTGNDANPGSDQSEEKE